MSQQQQAQQQQQQQVIPEQKSSQVLHIRGDSDLELEALFKAVMNPQDSQVPLTVPMRLRKLPNSFFQPPDIGSKTSSHSRESSSDSTSAVASVASAASANPFSPQQSPNSSAVPPPIAPNQTMTGLPIHHPRAHSSPASLQQTIAAAQTSTGTTTTHQHLRQQSYDITDDVPMPIGWEMAKTPTGQRYFLNHITQTTTWEDPRKKVSLNAATLHSSGGSTASSSGSSTAPSSPVNPLTTQALPPLPDGWEQANTAEGEVYFINHQTRTTSWFDPRIPLHLQRPAVLQQNQLGAPAVNPPPISATSLLQQRQQRVRLQRMQLERERLRHRNQELMKHIKSPINNTSFGQQNFNNNTVLPSYNDMLIRQTLNEGISSSPTTELPVSTTGIDPFLGSDFHARQESTDSGLGMGTNYSLPQTPEDFLSTMDDSMDPVSDDGSQQGHQQQQQTGGSDMGGLGDLSSTDLSSLGDNNMDSDELEPSLQEDLGSELMSDVEYLLSSSRVDNVLTWL